MVSDSSVSACRPELLAPAGNWECVRAAVANGADAVYFGLDKFNARMRADNFTREDLRELIPFLHGHGVRAYVTMNVLIFTSELYEAAEYVKTLNDEGVDGVIVQDAGLAWMISQAAQSDEAFSLELHASTQMTISCPAAMRFFERFLQLSQAVLARELSVREIEACAKGSSVPLEVFVHGALCVSYSGQCLTSESLGQRSANRGECAQACRMPYMLEVDGRMMPLGERRYLLSPQDLCAQEKVADLVRAGVRSFKIEGRLKSPEYVAAVTRGYRHALDAAMEGREVDARRRAEDLYAMQMVFSRGFSTGWLDGPNHPLLTHGKFGKKRGAYAGRIADAGKGWLDVNFSGSVPVRPGDGFVIDRGENRNEEQGGRIWKAEGKRLFFHGKASRVDWQSVRAGNLLWKTDDPALNQALRRTWAGLEDAGKAVHLHVSGREGEPLAVSCRAAGVRVESPQPLERAEKHALTADVLKAQFGRLGGTGYALGSLACEVPEGLMMPLSVLNRMRRELVEKLDAQPAVCGVRRAKPLDVPVFERGKASEGAAELSVLCRSVEQAEAALEEGVRVLYFDFTDIRAYREAVAHLRGLAADASIYLATLRIMKPREEGYMKFYEDAAPDGFLVRHAGMAEYLRGSGYRLAGDFSLNVANPVSAHVWREFGGMEYATISYDLNVEQVLDLLHAAPGDWFELTLHQHMPMFHMEHCVFCSFLSKGKNFTDCGRPCEKHRVRVEDRCEVKHVLLADEGCRNTLFNGQAQSGARFVPELLAAGLRRFRVELLAESRDEARLLVRSYRELLDGRLKPEVLFERLHAADRLGVTEGSLSAAGRR